MLTVKFLALELGALLVYAGIKGLSVGALLKGDNQTASKNKSLASGDALSGAVSAAPPTVNVNISGYSQQSGANLH
jgi:hypothetical protein